MYNKVIPILVLMLIPYVSIGDCITIFETDKWEVNKSTELNLFNESEALIAKVELAGCYIFNEAEVESDLYLCPGDSIKVNSQECFILGIENYVRNMVR